MEESLYHTEGGVTVHRAIDRLDVPHQRAIDPLVEALDSRQGAVFTSSYEYPGRYTRWDMGFVDPPLRLTFRGLAFEVTALNERGKVLLPAIGEALERCPHLASPTAVGEELWPLAFGLLPSRLLLPSEQ